MPKKKPLFDALTPFLMGDNNKVKESDESPRDELLLKIIDEVYSTDNIEVKTDLTPDQIIAFTRGKLYHKKFGSELMLNTVNELAIYSVSKDRKGRKEFTEISKALNSREADETDPRIRERLLGRGV